MEWIDTWMHGWNEGEVQCLMLGRHFVDAYGEGLGLIMREESGEVGAWMEMRDGARQQAEVLAKGCGGVLDNGM